MTTGQTFHGGGIDAAARRFGRPVGEWLDLSTGINPCPPSLPEIAFEAWHRLPDEGVLLAARKAAAGYYGTAGKLPVASAGTQPLIRALSSMVDSRRRVAVLGPTYGEYAHVFASAGFVVDEVTSLQAVTEAYGVAVIVNPNNPDGRVFERATLAEFARRLEAQGTMFILDEAFCDLSPEVSLVDMVADFGHLVVLRSFGKFFGYAGLRLSFAVAGPAYAEKLESWLGPWPVSGPALAVGKTLLEGDIGVLRAEIRERRDALGMVLEQAGLNVSGGTDLFALVEDSRAGEIFRHLAEQAILVRAFDYRTDWLRIGLFANHDDGQRLSEALKRFR